MEFLAKWLGTTNLPSGNKSFDEFLNYNSNLINETVQDLIAPFLAPSSSGINSPETDLSYTLKLMDADTCGQMAFFLSKNMTEMVKSFDISGFGDKINTFAPGSKLINEANIKTPSGMVSRKQICDRLAAHYVNILNLLAAILTAINPQTNMALSRMNSLYTLADENSDTFITNICKPEGKQLVKQNILDEPGLKEFMGLYLFHLLSVSESPADKDRVMQEYQNLVRKFFDDDRTVALSGELIPDEPSTNSIRQISTLSGAPEPVANAPEPVADAQEPVAGAPEPVAGAQEPVANAQEQPGIFDVITNKLSTGVKSLLSTNTSSTSSENQTSYDSRYYTPRRRHSYTYSTDYSSDYSSYNTEREQKRSELYNLQQELYKQQAAGNKSTVEKLREKIKNLINELESSSNNQYGGAGSLSVNASIQRFTNFIDKYLTENQTDKKTILRNVLTIFKSGHFKKPDNEKINKLCKNASAQGKEIKIKIDSNNQYLKIYKDNWTEMRHKYIKSVNDLVDILENHLLIQNPSTQKYDVRNISSQELLDLETKTRNILAQLYSDSHTHYVLGVNALYNYYHNLTSDIASY